MKRLGATFFAVTSLTSLWVAADDEHTHLLQMELASNGVTGQWSQMEVDPDGVVDVSETEFLELESSNHDAVMVGTEDEVQIEEGTIHATESSNGALLAQKRAILEKKLKAGTSTMMSAALQQLKTRVAKALGDDGVLMSAADGLPCPAARYVSFAFRHLDDSMHFVCKPCVQGCSLCSGPSARECVDFRERADPSRSAEAIASAFVDSLNTNEALLQKLRVQSEPDSITSDLGATRSNDTLTAEEAQEAFEEHCNKNGSVCSILEEIDSPGEPMPSLATSVIVEIKPAESTDPTLVDFINSGQAELLPAMEAAMEGAGFIPAGKQFQYEGHFPPEDAEDQLDVDITEEESETGHDGSHDNQEAAPEALLVMDDSVTTARRRGKKTGAKVEGCDEEFQEADGSDYMGCQTVTAKGSRCLKWTLTATEVRRRAGIRMSSHPGKGLGDHRFCRNPDGSKTIWCYIDGDGPDKGEGRWGYCEQRSDVHLDKWVRNRIAGASTSKGKKRKYDKNSRKKRQDEVKKEVSIWVSRRRVSGPCMDAVSLMIETSETLHSCFQQGREKIQPMLCNPGPFVRTVQLVSSVITNSAFVVKTVAFILRPFPKVGPIAKVVYNVAKIIHEVLAGSKKKPGINKKLQDLFKKKPKWLPWNGSSDVCSPAKDPLLKKAGAVCGGCEGAGLCTVEKGCQTLKKFDKVFTKFKKGWDNFTIRVAEGARDMSEWLDDKADQLNLPCFKASKVNTCEKLLKAATNFNNKVHDDFIQHVCPIEDWPNPITLPDVSILQGLVPTLEMIEKLLNDIKFEFEKMHCVDVGSTQMWWEDVCTYFYLPCCSYHGRRRWWGGISCSSCRHRTCVPTLRVKTIYVEACFSAKMILEGLGAIYDTIFYPVKLLINAIIDPIKNKIEIMAHQMFSTFERFLPTAPDWPGLPKLLDFEFPFGFMDLDFSDCFNCDLVDYATGQGDTVGAKEVQFLNKAFEG